MQDVCFQDTPVNRWFSFVWFPLLSQHLHFETSPGCTWFALRSFLFRPHLSDQCMAFWVDYPLVFSKVPERLRPMHFPGDWNHSAGHRLCAGTAQAVLCNGPGQRKGLCLEGCFLWGWRAKRGNLPHGFFLHPQRTERSMGRARYQKVGRSKKQKARRTSDDKQQRTHPVLQGHASKFQQGRICESLLLYPRLATSCRPDLKCPVPTQPSFVLKPIASLFPATSLQHFIPRVPEFEQQGC